MNGLINFLLEQSGRYADKNIGYRYPIFRTSILLACLSRCSNIEHLTPDTRCRTADTPGMMLRVVNTNKLSDILHISQSFTVKDPLGISGDKNKGDIGTGELIQVLTKFSPCVIICLPNDSALTFAISQDVKEYG